MEWGILEITYTYANGTQYDSEMWFTVEEMIIFYREISYVETHANKPYAQLEPFNQIDRVIDTKTFNLAFL